ncbi:mitochondrial ribosomal protein subunit [Pseudozyma hubeiensis SY62]|uniref:Mitochondrial ribosomal protein subunit n=1 Tax=Pseudozyma hubeiensis (strain SY62) TaxID=1305764 RepID=R9P244_PSEHS|nr:mitochondrial ribosomal protein subunit [Pseudozyma hubeiensis SY62]GAC95304.1 mitochondrial ribosomal protein subunit [Pseudozyma hubeiensis SY62]
MYISEQRYASSNEIPVCDPKRLDTKPGVLSLILFAFVWFQYHGSVPAELYFKYGSLAEHDHATARKTSGDEPDLEPIDLFRKYKVLPPLTSLRNSSGQFDFIQRKEAFGLYYVGHAFPGMLWSILMAVQNTNKFRKAYPRAHRVLGRITLGISTLLSLSGWALLRKKGLSYRHEDWSHLHKVRFNGTTVFLWPSFASMTDIIGILVMFTGYKTIVYARQGNYAAHRTWARFHTYAGFAIPVQRVWLGIILSVAMLIPLLPKSILQRFNYPSNDEAIYKAELGSQGLAVFLAAVSTAFIVYRDVVQRPSRRDHANVKLS